MSIESRSKQFENETRFLFQCQKYSARRQAFLNQVKEIEPNFGEKQISEKIKLLMNCDDYKVNKLVLKFICSCLNVRDTLLLSKKCNLILFALNSSVICFAL